MQQEERIHTALLDLAVAVGRLDEQMSAVRRELLHHTTNEHKSFDAALEVVSEIKQDVEKLQHLLDQSKGAWWALAKLAGVVFAVVTIVASVWNILAGK